MLIKIWLHCSRVVNWRGYRREKAIFSGVNACSWLPLPSPLETVCEVWERRPRQNRESGPVALPLLIGKTKSIILRVAAYSECFNLTARPVPETHRHSVHKRSFSPRAKAARGPTRCGVDSPGAIASLFESKDRQRRSRRPRSSVATSRSTPSLPSRVFAGFISCQRSELGPLRTVRPPSGLPVDPIPSTCAACTT